MIRLTTNDIRPPFPHRARTDLAYAGVGQDQHEKVYYTSRFKGTAERARKALVNHRTAKSGEPEQIIPEAVARTGVDRTEKKRETLLDIVQWWTKYALVGVIIAYLFISIYLAFNMVGSGPPSPERRCLRDVSTAMKAYIQQNGRLPVGSSSVIIRELEPFSELNQDGVSRNLECKVAENFSEIAFFARPLPEEMVRDQSIRVAAYIHVKGKAQNFAYLIDDTFSHYAGYPKDPTHVPAEQLLDRHIEDVLQNIVGPLTH